MRKAAEHFIEAFQTQIHYVFRYSGHSGTRPQATRCCLPAHVTADDDVAAEDTPAPLVHGVRDDGGGHGELDWSGVDDADDVAGSRGLEDAEERPVEAVLSVKFYDLWSCVCECLRVCS